MNVRIGLLLAGLAALLGCSKETGTKPKPSSGKIQVVVTTTTISDLVKQVGGDKVEVQRLMGP
ncbi:MAG TPA: manganese transporter, partial [Candidatus Binatia bacterium]|nr:manganese transporter [Candidatus Binatia bacterium]